MAQTAREANTDITPRLTSGETQKVKRRRPQDQLNGSVAALLWALAILWQLAFLQAATATSSWLLGGAGEDYDSVAFGALVAVGGAFVAIAGTVLLGLARLFTGRPTATIFLSGLAAAVIGCMVFLLFGILVGL